MGPAAPLHCLVQPLTNEPHSNQAKGERHHRPNNIRDGHLLLPAQQNKAAVSRNHSAALLSRNAFAITDTELNVIAALAIMGLSTRPKNG